MANDWKRQLNLNYPRLLYINYLEMSNTIEN